MKKINWKKVTRKALHTFWQAFLSAFIITEYTKEGFKIAIIASIFSAIKTTLMEMIGDDNNDNN